MSNKKHPQTPSFNKPVSFELEKERKTTSSILGQCFQIMKTKEEETFISHIYIYIYLGDRI